MEEPFIYMKIPFDMNLARIFSGSSNLANARILLGLSDEQIQAIAVAIRGFQGFLDTTILKSLLAPSLPEGSRPESLADFLVNLDRILARTGKSLGELFQKIPDEIKDKGEGWLSTQELELLETRLTLLLSDRSGFERQRKAERLAKSLGHPLSDVQIVCDLRPILNKDRTLVEGALVLSTIKIVARGPDELPVAFEARLTEKQVTELATRAKEAVEKIAVLRRYSAEMGFVIPTTELSS